MNNICYLFFNFFIILAQLSSCTTRILAELSNRQQILIKLLKQESPEANETEDTSLLFTNSSNELENSILHLNTLSLNLNNVDAKKITSNDLATQLQNTKILMKLEESLNKLRVESSADASKLPSLILPTSECDSFQNNSTQIHPAIGSDVTRLNRSRQSVVAYNRHSEPLTSTTQDLSEDEQINYYDDGVDEDEIDDSSLKRDSNFMQTLIDSKPNFEDDLENKKQNFDDENEDEDNVISETEDIDEEDDMDLNDDNYKDSDKTVSI